MIHPPSVIRAKKLRGNMPAAEVILWSKIQRDKLGATFRRQHRIGKYYADFACKEKMLVVELDGGQHGKTLDAVKYDNARTDFIKSQGWTLIRIPNDYIFHDLNMVIDILSGIIAKQIDAKSVFWEKYAEV